MAPLSTDQLDGPSLKILEIPPHPTLCEGDLIFIEHDFPEVSYKNYKNKMPHELFELYFMDELLRYISKQITNYSLFQNHPNPQVSVEELRGFSSYFSSEWLQQTSFEVIGNLLKTCLMKWFMMQ